MPDDRTSREELLIIAYQHINPYQYGSIVTIDPDTYASAVAQGGTLGLENWSAPYFIAKHLAGREIVYGSIPYLIGEAAKPIFRLNQRLNAFRESLHPEIRSSIQTTYEKASAIFTVPGQEFPEWFMHRQEELVKEALLLSSLHVRTLLDILNNRGNGPVTIYDYDGRPYVAVPGAPNGKVTLRMLCDMMIHHRYWVISSLHIHDLFSDQQELGSEGLFGSKVNYVELLQTMLGFLSGITVNDFVGVLRGGLSRLNTYSAPRDIMFMVQNVHALSQIIRERIGDTRFRIVQDVLFRELTADEKRQIEAAEGKHSVELVRRFSVPSFKIAEKLHEKRLTMGLTINDKQETFQLDQASFFNALTQAFGDDPILTLDKLVERYDKPEIEVLA